MSADLRHIDTWLFDLDNTLYPQESGLMARMEDRMSGVVARITQLPPDEAFELRGRYLREHGTTLAGLMKTHQIDPQAFLDECHDVPLDCLTPDPVLRAALEALPGRRLIFTNADLKHAERILDHLGLDHLFDDLFHIEMADYVPKPDPKTFARMVDHHVITNETTCFFEDSERNLAPAEKLGMTTVLVGPHALASEAAFVHHRTENLAGFLTGARLREN